MPNQSPLRPVTANIRVNAGTSTGTFRSVQARVGMGNGSVEGIVGPTVVGIRKVANVIHAAGERVKPVTNAR